ncbi:DUF4280 domain-containing protein [Pedobacter cryoconitis]|uniref:Uncharacterized protein DUF4280 n=1 Tax=Pedobacter cryoconitis TaxID=188932 RepID=A0A327SDP5_9SPHI|nr:DUF4280 domain-containing protein [Pedobacter cryoconitis]RAJ26044.1 uncharacterized protein DUF4280 [Pedobacter cryoconitis]
MAEKHLVVQGATCLCNFGSAPDLLKVLTHKREFANDKDGVKKYIASTKDIGLTFEKNTFGSCAKQLGKPCQAVVTEWKEFYEHTTLTNSGKVLTEASKATCPIGGPDCIKIIKHGQIAEPNSQSFKKSEPKVSKTLNPAVRIQQLIDEPISAKGIIFN